MHIIMLRITSVHHFYFSIKFLLIRDLQDQADKINVVLHFSNNLNDLVNIDKQDKNEH